MVARGVSGLKPNRVSIFDGAGELLADGAADATGLRHRPRAPRRF